MFWLWVWLFFFFGLPPLFFFKKVYKPWNKRWWFWKLNFWCPTEVRQIYFLPLAQEVFRTQPSGSAQLWKFQPWQRYSDNRSIVFDIVSDLTDLNCADTFVHAVSLFCDIRTSFKNIYHTKCTVAHYGQKLLQELLLFVIIPFTALKGNELSSHLFLNLQTDLH